MEKDIQNIKDYVNDLTAMKKLHSRVIKALPDALYYIVDHHDFLSINEELISDALSDKLKMDIDCKEFGIDNVSSKLPLFVKKKLFGSFLYRTDQLIETLQDMVRAHLSLCTKRYKKASDEKIESNEYEEVKEKFDEIDDKGNEEIIENFNTNINNSSSKEDIKKACDYASIELKLNKIESMIDDLEDDIDELKSRVLDLENSNTSDLENQINDLENRVSNLEYCNNDF